MNNGRFRLCPIASGSSGNCTIIEAGQKRLLVDIGISGKKVVAGLEQIDIDPASIDGILITHEHSDHIKGIGIYSRKYHVPIYATQKAWDKLLGDKMIGAVKEENIKVIEKENYLIMDDLKILPYGIYHDAVDPVGYIFEYADKKIALTTDIGTIDDRILNFLEGVDGLLLEFNHDIRMLEAGTYPFPLKRRILSDVGHLNNDAAAQALVDIYHPGLKWVVLGHLSKDNNVPDLAYITAKQALETANVQVGEDIEVFVAKRDEVSKWFEV